MAAQCVCVCGCAPMMVHLIGTSAVWFPGRLLALSGTFEVLFPLNDCDWSEPMSPSGLWLQMRGAAVVEVGSHAEACLYGCSAGRIPQEGLRVRA